MKSHLLFPRYLRLIGILLVFPGLILGYLFYFHGYRIPGFGPESAAGTVVIGLFDTYIYKLSIILVVIGLLFIAFSKVKNEDELTAHIRLNSLYWAILVNYLVLFIRTYISISFKEGDYYVYAPLYPFTIVQVNFIMPLVIFILRFYYLLYRNKDVYYAPLLHFLPYNPFNKVAKVLFIISLLGVVAIFIHISNMSRDIYWERYDIWYSKIFKIIPFVFLLWVYVKERKEDEYINTIRLYAMQTAIYINYGLLLLANAFLSGIEELDDLTALSIIPLIFIIVFQYRLYRLSKQMDDKKSHPANLSIL